MSVSGQGGSGVANTTSTENSTTNATVYVSGSGMYMYVVFVTAITECGTKNSTKGELYLHVHPV